MPGPPRHLRTRPPQKNKAHTVATTVQMPSATTTPRVTRSVLVGSEDVRCDARVADRRRCLEVAEGDRDLAIREEALHVVDPLGTYLHVDQAPKRAALDAVRRQVKGVELGRDDGQRERHVLGLGLVAVRRTDDRSTLAAEPSTGHDVTATLERY